MPVNYGKLIAITIPDSISIIRVVPILCRKIHLLNY